MGVLHQSHIPTSNLGSDMDCDVVTWKIGGIVRNIHASVFCNLFQAVAIKISIKEMH